MGKIAGLVFLSLVQFRIFVALHAESLFKIAQASSELLMGTPQHRAFQSRLLGPAVVQGVSGLSGWPHHTSHTLVLLLLTIAANLLAFALFRRMTASADLAFRYTVYFLAAALALLSGPWVFVWDFIEMMVFLLFAYGVFMRKPTSYFCLVFAAAIFNRESALAIALWLVIDAVTDGHGRIGRLRDTARLVTGVLLLAIGIVSTLAVREWLFVRSSLEAPDGYNLPYLGNQWNLGQNLSRAADAVLNPRFDLAIVFHLASIWLAVFLIRRWPVLAPYRSACLIVLVMWAAVPLSGFFDEARQYLYLVPFILGFDLAARQRLVTPASRSSQTD